MAGTFVFLAIACFGVATSLDCWPGGSYGLLATVDGCPVSDACETAWSTECKVLPANNGNKTIFANYANFSFKTEQQRVTGPSLTVCMNNDYSNYFSNPWPPGCYCIFKSLSDGSCPDGFEEGNATLDHRHSNISFNNFSVSSERTCNYETEKTIISFCCHRMCSGLLNTTLKLPTSSSFFLMASSLVRERHTLPVRVCPLVDNMNAPSQQVITFDTYTGEDSMTNFQGQLPLGLENGHLKSIVFCYYQPLQTAVESISTVAIILGSLFGIVVILLLITCIVLLKSCYSQKKHNDYLRILKRGSLNAVYRGGNVTLINNNQTESTIGIPGYSAVAARTSLNEGKDVYMPLYDLVTSMRAELKGDPVDKINGNSHMGMPVKQPESYMEPITTVELPDRSTEDLEESQMYQNLNSSNENLFNSQSIYMNVEKTPYAKMHGLDPVGSTGWIKDEEKQFTCPPSNQEELSKMLKDLPDIALPKESVRVFNSLGSGNFGKVLKGIWHSPSGSVEVAIKTLHAETTAESTIKFLQEACIMQQFDHRNILKLHGIFKTGDCYFNGAGIVLEYMTNGDMNTYLIGQRERSESFLQDDLWTELIIFARQIASGMEYLSKKKFVHCDLATRNILLDTNLTCKISDFGLAKNLYDKSYYKSNGGIVPFRWTAPEALGYNRWSSASDVWSYGCVLYELWSLGLKPLSDLQPNDAFNRIFKGYRQPPAPGCSRALYQLMIDCWNAKRWDRPSFSGIAYFLKQSDSILRAWSEEDLKIHPQVNIIGADPGIGLLMYSDLQNIYYTENL